MASKSHQKATAGAPTFKEFFATKLAKARDGGYNLVPQDLLKQAKKAGFHKARFDAAFVALDRAATKLRVVTDVALANCSIMTLASLEAIVRDAVDLEEAGCFSFLCHHAYYRGTLRQIQDIFCVSPDSNTGYTVEDALSDVVEFVKNRDNKFDRASLESFLVQKHKVANIADLGILVGSVPLLASTAAHMGKAMKRDLGLLKGIAERKLLAQTNKEFNATANAPGMDKLFSQMLGTPKAILPQDPMKRAHFCWELFKKLQQCLSDGSVTPKMLGLTKERAELLTTTVTVCKRLGIERDPPVELLARLEDEVLVALGEASFASVNDSRGFLDFLRAEADDIWPDVLPSEEDDAAQQEAAELKAIDFVNRTIPEWLLRDLSVSCRDAETILEWALFLGYCGAECLPDRVALMTVITARLEEIGETDTTLRTTCVSDLRAMALTECLPRTHWSAADAVRAIERVPPLTDIASATGWSLYHESTLGCLRDFVARNFRSSLYAFTAAGRGLVRLDAKPTVASLRTALQEERHMDAAIAVLSLVHKKTAIAEITLTLRESVCAKLDGDAVEHALGLLQCMPCPEHRLLVFNMLADALSARFSRMDLLEDLHCRDKAGILASMSVLDASLARHFMDLAEVSSSAMQCAPLDVVTLPPRTATSSGGSNGTLLPIPAQEEDPSTATDDDSPKAVILRTQKKWTADENMSEAGKAVVQHLEEKLSGMIGMASEDIYGSSDRFLMELVQNADDNAYPDGVRPALTIHVLDTGLLLHNNELGFTEQNVVSICDVQKSSKANKAGYIGEKGIGFKAVFKVSHSPEIHSNGYHFAFDTVANPRLGYVSPVWKDPPSLEAAPLIGQGGTVLYLPWRSSGESDKKWKRLAERELRGISSTVILFLSTLESIVAYNEKEELVRELVKTIEDKKTASNADSSGGVALSLSSSLLSVREAKRGLAEQSSRWWIYEEEVEMTCSRNDQQRTRIAMAFPLGEEGLLLKEGPLEEQYVCSFLPMKPFGFKFVLQADFSLVSSREAPKQDNAWNDELLARIPLILLNAFQHLRDVVCDGTDTSSESHLLNRFLEFLPLSVREPFTAVAQSMMSRFHDEPCVPIDSAGLFARPSEILIAPPLPQSYARDLSVIASQLGCRLLLREDSTAQVLARLGARQIDASFLVDTLHSTYQQLGHEKPSDIVMVMKACLRLWHAIGAPCKRLENVHCIPIDSREGSLTVMTVSEAKSQQVFVGASVSAKELRRALKGLSALSAQLLFVHRLLSDSEDVRKTLRACGLPSFSVRDMFDDVALPRILPNHDDFDPRAKHLVFLDAQVLAAKLCWKDDALQRRLMAHSAITKKQNLLLTDCDTFVPPCSISRNKKAPYATKSSLALSPRYRKVAKLAGVSLDALMDSFFVPRTFSLVRGPSGAFSSPELKRFSEWCEAQDSKTLKKAISPAMVSEDWKKAYRLYQEEPEFKKQLLELPWYICSIGNSWQPFSWKDLCDVRAVESELQIESYSTIECLLPCREPGILASLQPEESRMSLDFLLDLVTTHWAANGAIDSSLWEEKPNSLSAGIAPLAAAVYDRMFAIIEERIREKPLEADQIIAEVRERMACKTILRVATKGADVSFVEPKYAYIADEARLIEELDSGHMVLLRYYNAKVAGSEQRKDRLMEFFQQVLGIKIRPSVAEYVTLITNTKEKYSAHLFALLRHLPSMNIRSEDRAVLFELELPCSNGPARRAADCCWASWKHPACQWPECPKGIIDLRKGFAPLEQHAIANALMIPPIEACMTVDVVEGTLSTGYLPQRAMAQLLPLMQRYLCKNLSTEQFRRVDELIRSALTAGVDVVVLGDKDTRMKVSVTCCGAQSPPLHCKALYSPNGGVPQAGGKLYACSYYVELSHEFEAMITAFLRAFGVLDEKDVTECAAVISKLAKDIGIHLSQQNAVEEFVGHLELPTFSPEEEWRLMGADDSLVVIRTREPSTATDGDKGEEVSEESRQASLDLVDKLSAAGKEYFDRIAAAPVVEQVPSSLPGIAYTSAVPLPQQSNVDASPGGGGLSGFDTANDSKPVRLDPVHGATYPAHEATPVQMVNAYAHVESASGQVASFEEYTASSGVLEELIVQAQSYSDDALDVVVGRIGEEVAFLWLEEHGYTQVEWVNREQETGLPYDLKCVTPNGKHLFVEVKSTRCTAEDSKASIFPISAAEVGLLFKQNAHYALLRVCSALARSRQVCLLAPAADALANGKLQLLGMLNTS